MSRICALPTNYRTLLILSLMVLLSACGAPAPDVTADPADYAYIADVKVGGDSSAQLEQRYGGEVISYHPEADFAVLGFNKAAGELSVLADELEPNSAVGIGDIAQASGFNAWSSGFNAWSSGFNAWSSGTGSPAEANQLSNDNLAAFELIGLNQAYDLDSQRGAGIKVAVIDTGFDLDHVFLRDRLAPKHEWMDFVDGDRVPEDVAEGDAAMFGHGTAVAGLIAQAAPNATLLPIRVLNAEGAGYLDDVVRALDWAAHQGADVINLSLGTRVNSSILEILVAYSAFRNVHVVIAAGNAGQAGMDHPATYANGLRSVSFDHDYVLSVGSVNRDAKRSSFSNYGGNLEFMAPGENVFSIYPGDRVGSFTGTSFAAPQIAGMVALDLSEGGRGSAEGRLAAASTPIENGGNSYGIPSLVKLLERR